MPVSPAVNRASDPHLLAADLIDTAKDRYLKPVERMLQAGGVVVIALIYFAPALLWQAIPLELILGLALYFYQVRRWWKWASGHDIDPEFLLSAAREEELTVPGWLIRTRRGR